MQLNTIAAVLIVSLFATTMAVPARSAYYQQPSFFYPSLSSPQRLMLLPYLQQPSAARTHSRLTYDASAEQQVAEESAVSGEYEEPQYDSGLDTEAAEEIVEIEVPEASEAPEVPEESQVVEDEVAPLAEDLPVVAETPVEEAPQPLVPETSAVEVPEDVASDDEEAEGDTLVPVAAPRAAPRAARRPSVRPALPAGTFFPISLNGPSGSAIAIANSFSTGEGGSATSHAIAYGQPESTKNKARPVRRH